MTSSYPPLPPSPSLPSLSQRKKPVIPTKSHPTVPPKKKLKFAQHVVRQDTEVARARPQVSREQREKMSEKDLLNLIEKITTGFETKLTMVDYDRMISETDRNTAFRANEDMENFITSLIDHFVRYDIIEVLKEFPLLLERCPGRHDRDRFDGTTIDLIENWDQIGDGKRITVRHIGETVAWMKRYSTVDSESFLDDMDWQHRFLMTAWTQDYMTLYCPTLEKVIQQQTKEDH